MGYGLRCKSLRLASNKKAAKIGIIVGWLGWSEHNPSDSTPRINRN